MDKPKRTVTFLEPWGRQSWRVQYDGPYENNRQPHVELGEAGMASVKAGDTFQLTNLHCNGNANKGAVMWNLKDAQFQTNLMNLRNPAKPSKAHFTVYFGPNAYEKLPTMR